MGKTPDSTPEGIDRRSILKGIGTAGFAPISLTGLANAKSGTNSESVPTLDWLEGRDARRVLASLIRTREFRRLFREVKRRGDRVDMKRTRGRVARASLNGDAREIAYFEIITDTAHEAYLSIGRDPSTGDVTTAGIEYVTREDDATSTRNIDQGQQQFSSGPLTVTAIDGTNNLDTETFDVDPITAPGLSLKTPVGSGNVSVQSHGAWCATCQFAVGLLCEYGCGLPGWFLCGLLGIGTIGIGSISCISFVWAACGVISGIGCSVLHAPEKVCQHPDIDMCH